MTDRREFVRNLAGGIAGIVFTGCALTGAAQQTAPSTDAPRRRRVAVGGRRVRTVDVHGHCTVPEAVEMTGRKPTALETRGLVSTIDRLRAMDEQGIDVQALSINAFWYATDRDLARQIIRVQNERLAELCATHPDRFVAYASVALQYPDLAAEQLEEGMKKLGLRGAAIGGNVNGEELSSPRFAPFWRKAEDLEALIFLHPQPPAGVQELGKRLQGNGYLANVIGNPLETTIALSHLIFEGTLDQFPRLRICAAHGGGYLPSYADRSDHGCLTFPESCSKTPLKKHPTEYLRQMHFDSLVFTPEALRHLVAECGAGQIVMGTDYPYPWTSTAVDHILATPGLNDAERRAILGGTASALLKISE
jgi:aminocarboxymuconate-semialdehyde decarboxylase